MHHSVWKGIQDQPFILLNKDFIFNISNIKMIKYSNTSDIYINQMRIHINSCATRINNNDVIDNLNLLVDELENPKEIDFNWDLSIYQQHELYEEYSEHKENDINTSDQNSNENDVDSIISYEYVSDSENDCINVSSKPIKNKTSKTNIRNLEIEVGRFAIVKAGLELIIILIDI